MKTMIVPDLMNSYAAYTLLKHGAVDTFAKAIARKHTCPARPLSQTKYSKDGVFRFWLSDTA